MYVTRPVSSLRRSTELLALPPQEGPNSGYLVLFDIEPETTKWFGLHDEFNGLPFPQNKDLTVSYPTNNGDYSTRVEVVFISVLDQPLSSNRYYVIQTQRKHTEEASTSWKDEDMVKVTCCTHFEDVKPRPLDPWDIYQQFEIINKYHFRYTAPDGVPPLFLRRKYWNVDMRPPRRYELDEARGLDSSLRTRLPDFNFSVFNESSESIVVGKWYCPFMFVKEGMTLKEQMRRSTFYEMTLEQRWDKVFGCDNAENDMKVVPIGVLVNREEVFVAGRKAVCEGRNSENGVMWFRSTCDSQERKEGMRVRLRIEIVERMKWEQERVGWVSGDEKQARVELKRMNGSIVLTYDFKHTHQIRCKWK